MAKKPKVGIFSGYDPRPWVMEECADNDIKILEDLIDKLNSQSSYELVFPGRKKKGWDKLCYTTQLAQEYAQTFVNQQAVGIINVHQTWTFPQTSQQVVSSYHQGMLVKDATFKPRIVIASIQDTTVPGMVSGMATAGSYNQNGLAFTHIYGDFENDETINRIHKAINMFIQRAEQESKIRDIINSLHTLHTLEFGSFSLRMPTTRINQEELNKRWGITSENLDQQVLLDRAFAMFDWEDTPGKSSIKNINHKGVNEAVEKNYDAHSEKFHAIPKRHTSRDKYALQVAMYFATLEIAEEKGASAVTTKCQDECSSVYTTCCQATSFLGNNVDMLGRPKKIIPTSCETDLPTMYTQYLLKEISGKPSGFGDFRYVKTQHNGRGETILAIVNCGQHPQYYAGKETDSVAQKQANTEYPGQEHFYAAGGAAVRMRTAGEQSITVARLGVENGRLYLVGTVMETIHVDEERHKIYNESWPIIEGLVPVSDKILGRKWPSNHLGFVYGYHIPALIELAERMGIGYIIWDKDGEEYYKPS